MANEAGKRAAGLAGAALVRDGMTVGLGTGTTAAYFIEALAERIRQERLSVVCVATSRGSEALAARFGVTTHPLAPDTLPELTIDGADEIDPQFNLIKGGGGALVREKLVAASSGEMVVIADESKYVPVLGRFPLPVGIFPFGWQTTHARVERALGIAPVLRGGETAPFVTDDDLYILDLPCSAIPDPPALEARLRTIVGVAEVGLFVGIARRVLIGYADGHVEERTSR